MDLTSPQKLPRNKFISSLIILCGILNRWEHGKTEADLVSYLHDFLNPGCFVMILKANHSSVGQFEASV